MDGLIDDPLVAKERRGVDRNNLGGGTLQVEDSQKNVAGSVV